MNIEQKSTGSFNHHAQGSVRVIRIRFFFILSFGRINAYFPVVWWKKEEKRKKEGHGRGEENRREKGNIGEVRIYA